MKKVIGLLMLAGTIAHAEGIASLTAEFGGHSTKTNHSYRITQSAGKQWKLEDIAPCPSYPCAPKDHTVESTFTPEMLSDSRMADGNTEIKLSNEYQITFMNYGMAPPSADGTRQESYWKLTIKKGSVQEDVKLYLYPMVKTN
jgi:hypothetical protein